MGTVLVRSPTWAALGDQSDARCVCRAVSAATGPLPLRDRFPDSPPAPRRHGAPRSGSDRRPCRPSTSKSTKAMSAGERAEKAVVSTIKSFSLRPWRSPARKPGTQLDKRKGGRYAGRLRLVVVPDHRAKSLGSFVEGASTPSTQIVTDGVVMPTSPRVAILTFPLPHAAIPRLSTSICRASPRVFAKLKTWLTGTHHGVRHQPRQSDRNAFTCRVNRRVYSFNAFRSRLGIAEMPWHQLMLDCILANGHT